jgi:hypothetical protein
MSSRSLTISGQVGSEKFQKALECVKDDDNAKVDELIFRELRFDDATVHAILELLGNRPCWKWVTVDHCSFRMDAILSVLFQNGISNLHIATDISDNHPDIQQMLRAVSAGLEGCLQSLTLRIRGLGVDGATLLAMGLARTSSLTKLCISYSLITGDGVEPLASGLRSNTSIEEFDFGRCQRPDSDNAKLIASLRYHPKLRSIRLDGKRCGSESVMALASVLESKTCKIDTIDVSGGLDGGHRADNEEEQEQEKIAFERLAQSLRSNTSLRVLNLSRRNLSDCVMAALSSALEQSKNSSLRFLNLTHCRISDEGLLHLASSLPRMQGLQKLWLGGVQSFGRSSVRKLVMCGLRDNAEIVDLILPTQEQSYFFKRLAYYINLNGAGRRLLRLPSPPMPALWPLVLDRANKFVRFTSQDRTRVYTSKDDIIYYFLRNGPVLLEMGGL